MNLLDAATELRAEGWRLATIVATREANGVDLRYCFYHPRGDWQNVVLTISDSTREAPSLTPIYISADRHEREIEDLFGVAFEGHPRLGDFVLHEAQSAERQPHRVLREEGAFVMPVGPVFSGHAESAQYLLETAGEDVVRAVPRLFYKYRAIETLSQGRTIDDAILLAERCNGTCAFANGWGYCSAVEFALEIAVPPRALALRTFLAEFERIRHHVGLIREICESTALTVAANEAARYEEALLRSSDALCGHRYLFGVLAIGGLARDLDDGAIAVALSSVETLLPKIARLRALLEQSGSFLDRIENVGFISRQDAQTFELVGPVARASGEPGDLRISHPYGRYESVDFDVPSEEEGDGFARLRVLFREIEQSASIAAALAIPEGSVRAAAGAKRGSALGWIEAPRGAAFHWADVAADGTVLRYHFSSPSFRNWQGFHIATEGFAFQDFPIILATLGLSVAENDR